MNSNGLPVFCTVGVIFLTCGINLWLNEYLDELLVGVLVEADEYVESGGAVGDEVAVDLVGEDQVQEQLQETAQLLKDRGIPNIVPNHVAAQYLHNAHNFIGFVSLTNTYWLIEIWFNPLIQ